MFKYKNLSKKVNFRKKDNNTLYKCNIIKIEQMENKNNLPPSPSSTTNKKGVIMLGETGVGKSNLGNFITKTQNFKISSSINSETQNIAYHFFIIFQKYSF